MIVKTIGRSQENNIVITDEKVSRTHLQMVQDDNGNVSVIDLGSTNGTYVNGIRITGETHLKASDEVRIGNTILPWQGYFPPKQASISVEPITTSKTSEPKRNLKWLFIVGGVLLALLIAGGVLLFVNNKKKAEKERIERETEEQYEQLISAMGKDYSNEKKSREMAEKNAKIAEEAKIAAEAKSMAAEKAAKEAQTKSTAAEKAKIDAMAKEKIAKQAEKEAETKARKAEEARQKAETQAKEAENSKDAAVKKAAEDAKKDADAKTKEAEQAKKDAEAKTKAAEQAQKDAEKALDLTKDFYKQLNKANRKKKLSAVCNALGISNRGSDEDQYERIEDKFDNANDNATRADIIKKVKKAI